MVRAEKIIEATRDYDRAALVLVAGFVLGALVFALLVRRLPGPLTLEWRWMTLAALVAWSALEGWSSWRTQRATHALYAQIAPELELMARLDPPGQIHELPTPVLTSALDSGSLDEVLFADLSHRLAERTESNPRLLVMADRATPISRLRAALRIVKRAGVDRIGMLYTRGPAPVFRPGDPPETAYTLTRDFGMEVIDLLPCGASTDAPLVLCLDAP